MLKEAISYSSENVVKGILLDGCLFARSKVKINLGCGCKIKLAVCLNFCDDHLKKKLKM